MLPGMFPGANWNVNADLVPVVMIAQTPFVILVKADSKFQSLIDLISFAQKHPGEVNYGSAGLGSTNHIVTEYFASEAHINITHIPFKGMSEAGIALQAGNLDFIIAASSTAIAPVKSGKLKALAVSTHKRSLLFPNVPSSTEAGVTGFIASNWFALAVPKGSTKEFINSLQDDVLRSLTDNETREKLFAQGAENPKLISEDLIRFIRDDSEKWVEFIKTHHINSEH
jgi:tripartite-type tricarboxylate transporter receptor subunit TctC